MVVTSAVVVVAAAAMFDIVVAPLTNTATKVVFYQTSTSSGGYLTYTPVATTSVEQRYLTRAAINEVIAQFSSGQIFYAGTDDKFYILSVDGSNVKRITFGKGLYGTPVWSPRGDLIAFTKVHKGRFYIGVMRPDGSGERLLTENYYQEAPSWSPNGRVLIFYRETKTDSKGEGFSAKLWSIDLTGYNERMINTETDASDPAWSPLLSK